MKLRSRCWWRAAASSFLTLCSGMRTVTVLRAITWRIRKNAKDYKRIHALRHSFAAMPHQLGDWLPIAVLRLRNRLAGEDSIERVRSEERRVGKEGRSRWSP